MCNATTLTSTNRKNCKGLSNVQSGEKNKWMNQKKNKRTEASSNIEIYQKKNEQCLRPYARPLVWTCTICTGWIVLNSWRTRFSPVHALWMDRIICINNTVFEILVNQCNLGNSEGLSRQPKALWTVHLYLDGTVQPVLLVCYPHDAWQNSFLNSSPAVSEIYSWCGALESRVTN